MNLKEQTDLLDKATNKAIKQVTRERKGKRRNFILEWFRYVNLLSDLDTAWHNHYGKNIKVEVTFEPHEGE